MIWPLIPRAHWPVCALFAVLLGGAMHIAERCTAGFAMTGAL